VPLPRCAHQPADRRAADNAGSAPPPAQPDVEPVPNATRPTKPQFGGVPHAPRERTRRRRHQLWAEFLRRVFLIDALICTHFGRPRRVQTFVSDHDAILKIRPQLGLPGLDSLAGSCWPPATTLCTGRRPRRSARLHRLARSPLDPAQAAERRCLAPTGRRKPTLFHLSAPEDRRPARPRNDLRVRAFTRCSGRDGRRCERNRTWPRPAIGLHGSRPGSRSSSPWPLRSVLSSSGLASSRRRCPPGARWRRLTTPRAKRWSASAVAARRVRCSRTPGSGTAAAGASAAAGPRRPRGVITRWRTTRPVNTACSSADATTPGPSVTPGSGTAPPGPRGIRRPRPSRARATQWRSTPRAARSSCSAASARAAVRAKTRPGHGTAIAGSRARPPHGPRRAMRMPCRATWTVTASCSSVAARTPASPWGRPGSQCR
jgi:hypothetical protein